MGRKLKKPRIRPKDGLSSLPDAILVDILSLLSLKSAVSTAVLSRRWRHLWTQTTSVDIDCRHFKDFYTTVDQLLPKLTSPIIRNFTLRVPLEPDTSSPPRSLVIGSWLQRVCARKVEKIVVAIDGTGDGDVVIGTLPTCIFETQSLVVLEFGNKLDYKLPVEIETHYNNMINLPNLVTLRLNLYASQCGLFAKLIKCCPLLEDLRLDGVGDWESSSNSNGEDDGFVVDISNDNVKRLNVMLPHATEGTKMVVDAPNLTSFVLIATFVTCSFVKKPVSLREASVFCTGCFGGAQVRPLLPVICNVVLLTGHPLIFYALNGVFADDTTPWSFPNLRRLHFHYDGFESIDDASNLFPMDSVPARRLLLHVKTIVIQTRNVIHGKHLLHFAKGLLGNAPVLERLVIRVTDQRSSDMNIWVEEALFFKELYTYPMISSLCQVEFYVQNIKLPGSVEEVMQIMARHYEDMGRELRNLLDMYRQHVNSQSALE